MQGRYSLGLTLSILPGHRFYNSICLPPVGRSSMQCIWGEFFVVWGARAKLLLGAVGLEMPFRVPISFSLSHANQSIGCDSTEQGMGSRGRGCRCAGERQPAQEALGALLTGAKTNSLIKQRAEPSVGGCADASAGDPLLQAEGWGGIWVLWFQAVNDCVHCVWV